MAIRTDFPLSLRTLFFSQRCCDSLVVEQTKCTFIGKSLFVKGIATQLTLEMGYTAKEFDKVLNGVFSSIGSDYICTKISENNWQIEIIPAEASLQINVHQNPPRLLGSLEIPVLLVNIDFVEVSSTQKQKFLDRFRRYFHKGGG